MQIQQYQSKNYEEFKGHFREYFRTDLEVKVSEEQLEDVCLRITRSVENGLVYLDIFYYEGQSIGFIEYQVDSNQSDWCEREGWGFVREFYIAKEMRRKGLGTKVVRHVENKLYSLGVENIYLTADDRVDFWVSCGYKNTKEKCNRNNGLILLK